MRTADEGVDHKSLRRDQSFSSAAGEDVESGKENKNVAEEREGGEVRGERWRGRTKFDKSKQKTDLKNMI